MPRGIINLKDLGVDQKYLTCKPNVRKMLCKEVLLQSFQRMSVNTSEETKVKTMKTILNKSLLYYEEQEDYENCIILNDLLKVLESDY